MKRMLRPWIGILTVVALGGSASATSEENCDQLISDGEYSFSQRTTVGTGDHDENGMPVTSEGRQELAARQAAKQYWLRAFRVCRQMARREADPEEAGRLIARGFWAQGRSHETFNEWPEASAALEQGIRESIDAAGRSTVALVPLYRDLSSSLEYQGATRKVACGYLRTAFEIEEAEYGTESPLLIASLKLMAICEEDERGAEAYYQRILQLVRAEDATADQIQRGLGSYISFLVRNGRAGEVPAVEELRQHLLSTENKGGS